MKKFFKHTILILCFLLSTAQGLHLLGHVLNSHHEQENKKELVHIVDDHKCSICNTSFYPLQPDNNYSIYVWSNYKVNNTPTFYINKNIESSNSISLKLRGPPIVDLI